jgi:hypothetical protein
MGTPGGECSPAEIDRVKSAARQHQARVVVGTGGGKVLDTARGAAADIGLPVVSCPTVASGDAPCSALLLAAMSVCLCCGDAPGSTARSTLADLKRLLRARRCASEEMPDPPPAPRAETGFPAPLIRFCHLTKRADESERLTDEPQRSAP